MFFIFVFLSLTNEVCMKSKFYSKYCFILNTVLFFTLFIISANELAFASINTPFNIEVRIDELPLISETTTLTCTVESEIDLPNSKIEITLPSDVHIIGNGYKEVTWKGDLIANTPISLINTIMFSKVGKKEIHCAVLVKEKEGVFWSNFESLYITIDHKNSKWGHPKKNYK